MRRYRFLLPLAATFAAVGCGGAGESADPVATNEVTMAKSYRFEPKTIVIESGQTVTGTNEDNFTHTVQVDGREDHRVGKGESVSLTFDMLGIYHYVCTLHRRDMDGEVVVE